MTSFPTVTLLNMGIFLNSNVTDPPDNKTAKIIDLPLNAAILHMIAYTLSFIKIIH